MSVPSVFPWFLFFFLITVHQHYSCWNVLLSSTERLLRLDLEERRKEYRRQDYISLDNILTWREEKRCKRNSLLSVMNVWSCVHFINWHMLAQCCKKIVTVSTDRVLCFSSISKKKYFSCTTAFSHTSLPHKIISKLCWSSPGYGREVVLWFCVLRRVEQGLY